MNCYSLLVIMNYLNVKTTLYNMKKVNIMILILKVI
nr:MAG TPA: hypothetical protein [Caudoviricetes sp.]